MTKKTLFARSLLGIVFFVFGLMGLLKATTPPPTDLPEKLLTFSNGLFASGYFFPLLKICETLCGLFLLTGFFVPLALVILAPITINILMVHIFLANQGLPIAIILIILMAYLSFFSEPYSKKIKELFKAK